MKNTVLSGLLLLCQSMGLCCLDAMAADGEKAGDEVYALGFVELGSEAGMSFGAGIGMRRPIGHNLIIGAEATIGGLQSGTGLYQEFAGQSASGSATGPDRAQLIQTLTELDHILRLQALLGYRFGGRGQALVFATLGYQETQRDPVDVLAGDFALDDVLAGLDQNGLSAGLGAEYQLTARWRLRVDATFGSSSGAAPFRLGATYYFD